MFLWRNHIENGFHFSTVLFPSTLSFQFVRRKQFFHCIRRKWKESFRLFILKPRNRTPLCWKKQKEEGSMIAFLLKRNNWTKIVLQQADFYCGEKKNGVSPIDIKRFKGRTFSNPLLVVFAKVPKFRETNMFWGEGNKRIERNFIHEEKIIFSKFDENK